jgi:hypothetical protein
MDIAFSARRTVARQIGRERVPVDSQYYHAEQGQSDRDEDRAEAAKSTATPAATSVARRDAEGRWQKGASGNPAGRPMGSRNRATLMSQMLLDASAAIMTSKAIERASADDGVTLRFCLARILAPRRTPPIELDLPPLDTAKDLARAMAAIGMAAAEGSITPAEALDLARVIDTALRAIEARDAEFRENHFWGRERSPAAPPLIPAKARSATD